MVGNQHPNIIVISLDSLRPDHLGCAGYHRDTSPNLDRFTAEGIRFSNFYSIGGCTLPSHTGLFTGLEAATSRMTRFPKANNMLLGGKPYLVDILKGKGYARGAFVAEFAMASFPKAFRDSFDDHEVDFGNRDGMGMQQVVEKSLGWIRKTQRDNLARPFFLYAYTGDIHTRGMAPDYQTDPEFMRLWTEHPDPTVQGRTPEEREKVVAQYDACIRYVDFWLGELFDGIKAQGIDDNTLIVIISDHGDLLWEQGGGFFGHQFLYDSVLHSVLLMRWPRHLASGSILNCLADHTDIAPTIADLAGLPVLPHSDGESLLPVIQGKCKEINEGLFAYRTEPDQWSIRTHEWKYVRTSVEGNGNALQMQFARERSVDGEELYDQRADPGERNNVVSEHPEVITVLKERLEHYIERCRAKNERLGLHIP